MLRRFLSLLLVLPLLLPQGVCVCDLVQACVASNRGAEQTQAPLSVSRCRCCKHKHAKPVHETSLAREQAPAGNESSPLQRGPDEHVPGCPAGTIGGLLKTAANHNLMLRTLSFSNPVALTEASCSVSRPLGCVSACHFPDQPLYLTLHTLLI